jgi:succinate dehydrogenase/fumarate reductase flavoprotein subunit
VLAEDSAPAVEWLINNFGLDLSLVSRLGGHSEPRTHRGKERFPGMTITYALMEKYEEIAKAQPTRARLITRARVVKILKENNEVVGVEYVQGGETKREYGAVIIATGGYANDFEGETSLLKRYKPEVLNLPTTNGDHCTGDGIKMGEAIGAALVDMQMVQVHPTGLVDPKEPDAKVKFLAAEALRGVGGILLNRDGDRFVDELGHRDFVTGEIVKTKNVNGGAWLILNGAAAKEIEWHVIHYSGRGIMQKGSQHQRVGQSN